MPVSQTGFHENLMVVQWKTTEEKKRWFECSQVFLAPKECFSNNFNTFRLQLPEFHRQYTVHASWEIKVAEVEEYCITSYHSSPRTPLVKRSWMNNMKWSNVTALLHSLEVKGVFLCTTTLKTALLKEVLLMKSIHLKLQIILMIIRNVSSWLWNISTREDSLY